MNVVVRLAIFLVALVVFAPALVAQEDAPAESSTPVARPAYASASATLRTFLRAFPDERGTRPDRVVPDAVDAIEFSGSLGLLGVSERRAIAYELRSVIDRLLWVDYETVDKEVGDHTTYVVARTENSMVVLERQRNGEWKFTAETVAQLPQLLDDVAGRANVAGTVVDLRHSPRQFIRELMPPTMQRQFVMLEIWQWLGLLLLIGAGFVADRIVRWIAAALLGRVLRRGGMVVGSDEVKSGVIPFGLLAMAGLWYVGLGFLLLPPTALGVLLFAVRVVGSIAFIWVASKLVDLAVSAIKQRAAQTSNRYDDLLIPFLGRIFKIFIVAFSLVFVAHNMGLDITSLLAGLGLGGLAFALAAKDTVENLFGSMTVLLDRPFRVGDWVVIPGGGVEGVVESVGLRSTRIRTLNDSLITVPNATLIRSNVENLGERRARRWRTNLGVQYDTPPEKLEAFCEAIRELIRQHPATQKDTFQVQLNEFADSSISILLHVFFEVPDWGAELRERHRLAIDILRVARTLGVQFAFPTQTVHLVQGQATQYADIAPDQATALAQGRDAAVEAMARGEGKKP